MSDVPAALSVALLFVLAGCTGAISVGETNTPTDAERLAPGVTTEGVTNASALVAAHAETVEREGFRSFSQVNYTGTQYGEGPFVENVTRYVSATPNATVFRYRGHGRTVLDGRTNRSWDRWTNGSVVLLRHRCTDSGNTDSENVVYVRRVVTSSDFEGYATHFLPIVGFLREADYRVVAVNRLDDRTLVTLEAHELDESADTIATDIDARVIVDGAGRIHSLNVTHRWPIEKGEMAGTTAVKRFRYELSEVGVERVPRPKWSERAMAADENTDC